MSTDKVLFKHDDPHGHGDIQFVWQNGGAPTYLCTTGTDGSVAIFNRQGQLQERIMLQSLCCGIAWDHDGDILAILTLNSSQVIIWDANSQKKQILDVGLRDNLSCLIWSKRSPILAIGTARGNLTIYNHQTTKRVPIIGKHSKRILCGAWSTESILALGSEDRCMSLSNEEGDTLKVVQLRDTPSDMHFAEMKTDERLPGENTISMIIGKRTLFLYHLHEPDSPTELGFQNRYGPLIQHKWFGDGYVLLGFGLGFIVSISTHPREVGQELWQVKNHRDSLSAIAVCQELELIASCGDNNVKIHSMTNLQETRNILSLSEQSGVKNIDWSSDGQLLAASTTQGAICVFITQLCSLHAVYPPRIALLSSLAEVSLFQYVTDKMKNSANELQLEIEPSFLAIGPQHLACGMNNHVWFYDLGQNLTDSPLLLGDREYMNEVKSINLNSNYAAVLTGSHIFLHAIDGNIQNPSEKHDPKLFPEDIHGMEEAIITCSGLTNNFLAFASDLGHLVYFSLEQWAIVNQYRHTMGVKGLHMDFDGTKCVIIDDHNQGYVFTPSSKDLILIPEFSKTCKGVVWDFSESNVFVTFDNKICAIYIYVNQSIKGKYIEKVGETQIMSDQIPILLHEGELCLSAAGGKLTSIRLTTHYNTGIEPKEQLKIFTSLRKYEEAWKICKIIDDKDECIKLGNIAIADLNVDFAMKVFRSIGNAAMVFGLEEIQYIEDKNLLSGHCALLLEQIDEAKSFFTESINPQEALSLCRDLLQCEQAIALATKLSPEQVPFIAREYAQQLEFTGNFGEALSNFEKGLNNDIIQGSGDTKLYATENISEHILACRSGIARTSIKTGDYRKGIKMALEMDDKLLLNDCGDSLVTSGHIAEAAQLFEKAENWDKACDLYIQQKTWNKVENILSNVTSLKLHIAYAKAKEAEGKFQEAIKSYTIADDMDSVIRIYLDYLSDPHNAGEIVMETKSVDGAKMLARFYQQLGDYESTLQYLVICGCLTEAFPLAQKHNKLKFYAELLEHNDSTKSTDFLVLAQHFEYEKYTLLAGKYYFLAKEFSKALKHLIKASAFSNEENSALSLAVDCVATSNDERLVTELIEYLLGESDGVPKDPKMLFRLYMARKQYKEAAKTAVIIANQEQVNGNYKIAHELLFSLYQELKRNQLAIASDLRYNLILLHRYMLVRIHMKKGDHLLAAKLLVQVAENISQFPSHIVPILTSTVIECQRAGLKKSAFSYAVMLMRAEYRHKIDIKYAKKIEGIVRKAPKDIKNLEDELNTASPCPVCDTDLPNMEITCYQCKTTLPVCIATGQHIVKKNITSCPECNFLCLKSDMIKILDELNNCPMCGETVDSNRLVDIDDVNTFITIV